MAVVCTATSLYNDPQLTTHPLMYTEHEYKNTFCILFSVSYYQTCFYSTLSLSPSPPVWQEEVVQSEIQEGSANRTFPFKGEERLSFTEVLRENKVHQSWNTQL